MLICGGRADGREANEQVTIVEIAIGEILEKVIDLVSRGPPSRTGARPRVTCAANVEHIRVTIAESALV